MALAVALVAAGCGGEEPDPPTVVGAVNAPRAVTGEPDAAWTWRRAVPDTGVLQVLPVDDDVVAVTGDAVARVGPDGRPVWVAPYLDAAWVAVADDPPGGVLVGTARDTSTQEPAVVGVGWEDGEVRWTAAPPASLLAVGTDLVLVEDPEPQDVVALDAATGEERWRSPGDLAVAVSDGVVVLDDGVVRRLDPTDGSVVWETDVVGTGADDLLVSGDRVVVVTDRMVEEVDPDDGTSRWRQAVQHGATAGFLSGSQTWVRPVTDDEVPPEDDGDGDGADGTPTPAPAADEDPGDDLGSVQVWDSGGTPVATLDAPPSFAGQAFGSEGETFVLDDRRLLDADLEPVRTFPDDVVPADGGAYEVADDRVSLLPLGPGDPAWTLPTRAPYGATFAPVDGAFYLLGPDGLTRYE